MSSCLDRLNGTSLQAELLRFMRLLMVPSVLSCVRSSDAGLDAAWARGSVSGSVADSVSGSVTDSVSASVIDSTSSLEPKGAGEGGGTGEGGTGRTLRDMTRGFCVRDATHATGVAEATRDVDPPRPVDCPRPEDPPATEDATRRTGEPRGASRELPENRETDATWGLGSLLDVDPPRPADLPRRDDPPRGATLDAS